MKEKLTGIVLSVRKYNDRHNVVTLYTPSHGRLSFLAPLNTSKKTSQPRLQPLTVIETEANVKPTADLLKLGAYSLHIVWTDIYFNPPKSMMALFISEFLNRLLNASMPDPLLWNYIYESVTLLDKMTRGLENYHIAFLSSLLPFVGIQPDITDYQPGDYFDMREGTFSSSPPFHRDFLAGHDAYMAMIISRINFMNSGVLKLSGNQRHLLLTRMLDYFAHHFPGLNNIRSLDILHEIFH